METSVNPEGNVNLNQTFCGTDTSAAASGRTLRNRSTIRSARERTPQKRQALQDMARPLKHWLIKHRHNPYPTKTEKIDLALGSRMTLVQVSNWFANARRRLKNTVREDNLSWANRIKLYNSNVVGNAELLSIHSEDSIWNSGEETVTRGTTCLTAPAASTTVATSSANEDHSYSAPDSCSPLGKRSHCSVSEESPKRRCYQDTGRQSPDSTFLRDAEDDHSPTSCLAHKYKSHILQRYLHDVCSSREVQSGGGHLQEESEERKRQRRRKNPNPKPTAGHPLRTQRDCVQNEHQQNQQQQQPQITKRKRRPKPPTGRYLKELDAAMALATLARVARNSSMTTVHQDHRLISL